MKYYVNIVSGPSKLDLIDSFMHAMDKEHVHRVEFTVAGKTQTTKIQSSIIGLSHEDGSGESFNLLLNISDESADMLLTKGYSEIQWLGHYKCINAYYNAKSRTGTITIK